MTGALGIFQSDPTFKTLQNVKDPWYQSYLTGAGSDLNAARGTQASALKDYITKYLAGEPAAQARTGQEIGNIDRYYNGDVQSELAGLRAQRGLAVTNAANLAQRYALANQNRSLVGNEGGGSSYDRRLAFRNMGDIQTQAALDAANQSRNDYGYLENARLGLTGRRQQMANDLAGYGLVPENVRMQMLGQQVNLGNTIGSGLLNNSIWGVQQNRDTLDKVISGMDKDTATITNLIAAVRGGSPSASGPASPTVWGGGQPAPVSTWGGPTTNQVSGFNAGFGPVSIGSANDRQNTINSFVTGNPYSYPPPSGNPYSPPPMSLGGGGWGSWPGSDPGMGGWAY